MYIVLLGFKISYAPGMGNVLIELPKDENGYILKFETGTIVTLRNDSHPKVSAGNGLCSILIQQDKADSIPIQFINGGKNAQEIRESESKID